MRIVDTDLDYKGFVITPKHDIEWNYYYAFKTTTQLNRNDKHSPDIDVFVTPEYRINLAIFFELIYSKTMETRMFYLGNNIRISKRIDFDIYNSLNLGKSIFSHREYVVKSYYSSIISMYQHVDVAIIP